MSFHWNLSSDEEDEEGQLDQLWKNAVNNREADDEDEGNNDLDDGFFIFGNDENETITPKVSAATAQASVARFPSHAFRSAGDDDGDDDSVDWEEAGGSNEHIEDGDDDKKPAETSSIAKRPLQAVTIELNPNVCTNGRKTEKKKKRIKSKRNYRFDALPRHTKFLVDNLHKAHLLALASHVVYYSSLCSDEMVLPVAFSLIPSLWSGGSSNSNNDCGPSIADVSPTLEKLTSFLDWFLDLVQNAEERRTQTLRSNIAAGAPQQPDRRRRSSNPSTVGTVDREGRKRKSILLDEGDFLVASAATRNSNCDVPSATRILAFCSYLALSLVEDPQLFDQDQRSSSIATTAWSSADQISLFIAMTRYGLI